MENAEFERDLEAHGLRPDEADGPDGGHGGRWGWTPGRIVSAVLLLGVIAFWVWAFSPLAPRGHPDELDDPAFAEAAEIRCAAAVDQVATEVPAANEATSTDNRADQIDASTAIFEEMLVDLAALAPAAGTSDREIVDRWLADWQIYIGDRYRYAERFRDGIDDRFEVTAVDEGQVTDPIDAFALANRMPSCASPQDV